MSKKVSVFLLFVLGIILTGCPKPPEASPSGEPQAEDNEAAIDPSLIRIAVSIPPQKEFVQKIAGGKAHVISMVGSGAYFPEAQPTEQQLAKLSSVQIYFKIGAPFEKNLPLPQGCKVVDMTKGVKLKPYASHTKYINGKKSFRHDPYVWMSPSLVVKMLTPIYQALRDLDPDGHEGYTRNFTRFVRELNSLEGDIKRIVLPAMGKQVYVYRPVLGYFCDDFGIKQSAFTWEEGRDLNDLARSAITNKVHTIFFVPYVPEGVETKLGGIINGVVAPLDPLAEGYFDNMTSIANSIRSGALKAK